MNQLLRLLLISIMLCTASVAKSQVIISLLFGEALNTPKIEFGLIGGFNQSYLLDIEEAERLNNFNIGFYFHINMKGNSFISTGVLVKSNVGAKGMPVYSVGDPDFDEVFEEAELTKKISYFYVPITFQQRFYNRFYIEGGIQAGLRNKADDYFNLEAYDGDLEYKVDARDQYAHLDFGLVGGVGYKLSKELKSMALGVNYYYGLVDVSTQADVTIKNSSLYVYMKLPIGTHGKDKK